MLAVSLAFVASAQSGGQQAYSFLRQAASARAMGLGNDFVSINDGDLSLAYANPSFINSSMNNKVVLNFVPYTDGAFMGFGSYSRTFGKVGSFAATVQFADYGSINATNSYGEYTGQVIKPSEYALTVGWAKQLDTCFAVGVNVKGVFSYMSPEYRSGGIAADVAASYFNGKGFAITLAARNIGSQVSGYYVGNMETMPFDLSLGFSNKFAHTPIRLSFVLKDLTRWNLSSYSDPLYQEKDPTTGEIKEKSKAGKVADEIMRHIVLGAELDIKYVNFQIGYNYGRRQEMKDMTKRGLVGFSWGLGIRVKQFAINYAMNINSLAGFPSYITFALDIDGFRKK